MEVKVLVVMKSRLQLHAILFIVLSDPEDDTEL